MHTRLEVWRASFFYAGEHSSAGRRCAAPPRGGAPRRPARSCGWAAGAAAGRCMLVTQGGGGAIPHLFLREEFGRGRGSPAADAANAAAERQPAQGAACLPKAPLGRRRAPRTSLPKAVRAAGLDSRWVSPSALRSGLNSSLFSLPSAVKPGNKEKQSWYHNLPLPSLPCIYRR